EKILPSIWFPISLIVIIFLLAVFLLFGGIVFLIEFVLLEDLIIGIISTIVSITALVFTIWGLISVIKRFKLIKESDKLLQDEDVEGLILLVEKGYQLRILLSRLGELGKKAKKTIPLIVQILAENNDGDTRAIACWALGKIKDKDAIPVLLNCIKSDPVPIVRVRAIYALSKFNRKFKEKLPEIYPILKHDTNLKNRVNIALSLADLNIIEALPVIKGEFNKDKEINEKFLFGWSIALLEGIYSDVITEIEDMITNNKLSRLSKKRFKNFYHILIENERSKKKSRRKVTQTITDIDLLREELLMYHELEIKAIMGMRTEKEEERSEKKKGNYVGIWQSLIGLLGVILAVLLGKYLI
ncbi:MAG: HEAT repeat domain-containing protein, partial [Candidatus Heimdallarchaeaceae archaeon]